MEAVIQALWRNQGQVLTPELIHGLAVCSAPVLEAPQDVVSMGNILSNQYGSVVFQVERLADILDEVSEHHKKQWDEIETHREGLNPNYEYMIDAEKQGRYVLFTARKQRRLIGNTGCYVYESLHTKKLSAKEDTMYIVPEERKGMFAVHFFKYCEAALKSLGVEEVTVQVKTSNKVYKLWERQGYVFTDRVLSKNIK